MLKIIGFFSLGGHIYRTSKYTERLIYFSSIAVLLDDSGDGGANANYRRFLRVEFAVYCPPGGTGIMRCIRKY